MIWEELNESLIMNHLDAKDSSDVFEKIGGTLIREGYAKDDYVDALIEREKDFPTGLDIGGIGIAIPHTSVDHVLKHGIAIANLKHPVQFIQMGMDDEPVDAQLVFMMAVTAPGKHVDQLQRLVDIIQDRDVLSRLLEADNQNEIISIIKDKEETL